MSVLDLSLPANIRDAIWLCLHVRRGAFFQQPRFGSDLHRLRAMTASEQTAKRAVGMARRALAILIAQGRLRSESLTVSATYEAPTRLRIDVAVSPVEGTAVELSTFVPVGVIA